METTNTQEIPNPGASPSDGIRLDNTVTTPTNYDEYRLKAIVSGKLVELYYFEVPLLLNHINKKTKRLELDRTEEYRERTANKGSFLIRRLLHSNFKTFDKFISLTFHNDNNFDISSLEACEKYKVEFLAKLKRSFKKDLKYIVVSEYQKRGAVHYHIVCDLPFVEKEKIQELFPYGFLDIRAIDNIDKKTFYLTKYITKNRKDPRFVGKKAYFTSTNLVRSKPMYGYEAKVIFNKVKDIPPIRVGQFETVRNGLAKFIEILLP